MIAFLFPGQGSQAPGMCKDFYENSPAARVILNKAQALVGEALLKAMFEGPAEALTDTRMAQPALLTAGAAITARLRELGHCPAFCAGHSLGEFSALVAAEALDFDSALRLVQVRARLMSENVPAGAMAAIVGLDAEAIRAALPAGVDVANYNGPQQTIISGAADAVQAAEAALKAAGAKRVLPLQVSGPFHSSLMRPAAEAFRDALSDAPIAAPSCAFISSVTGGPVDSPEGIREALAQQIASPVRWTEVMARLGAIRAFEVGPGKVLQGIAKRMDGAPAVESAGTLEAVDALEIEAVEDEKEETVV